MTKLHRCPECGRSHTGFTERCGDCLSRAAPKNWLEQGVEDARETHDYKPVLRNCVTKRRGRPRVHKDNAEKQRAWRERNG